LLAGGADPRATNRNGSTPLHLAVQTTGRGGSGSDVAKEHQPRIIELLLAHGARASDRDAAGRTVTAIAQGTPLESGSSEPRAAANWKRFHSILFCDQSAPRRELLR
jgi:ankyrin repeat protein